MDSFFIFNTEQTDRFTMLLELINIAKSYPSGSGDEPQKVLENINLFVDKSDRIAITGPSGSGKTTLLYLMGLLEFPDAGTIKFGEEETVLMNEIRRAEIRNQAIGFIFQKHLLLPQLSVIDNILLPVIASKTEGKAHDFLPRAEMLLEKTGLIDKRNKLPEQLSVGESQRIAVVRALILSPSIILADEPTGSLDKRNAEQTISTIVTLAEENTSAVVLVTHNIEHATEMKRHFVLENGTLTKVN